MWESGFYFTFQFGSKGDKRHVAYWKPFVLG